MQEHPVKVVVDDAHLGEIERVCRAVHAAGLTVERVVEEAGTIFGHCAPPAFEAIGHVEGVLRADPEEEFEVPGPDQAPQ